MNVRLKREQKIKIGSPRDLYEIMQKVLCRESRVGREKEHFWVVGLAISNKIAYIELVSLGSITTAVVTPLEVFNLAVLKKSPRIVLVHNHPSGELLPSKEDKKITAQILAGSKILGIEVLDHLIVSETGYYSFAEHNLL